MTQDTHILTTQGQTGKQHRIVCAACKANLDGQVVLGVRHFDALMQPWMKMSATFNFGGPCEQGFIDNRGEFLTRTEAWKVAEDAGQILYRVHGDTANGGTLYSENLY